MKHLFAIVVLIAAIIFFFWVEVIGGTKEACVDWWHRIFKEAV